MRLLKYRKRDRARAVNRKRHEDNAQRVKLRVTKGDTVRVMRGDDKGKEGKVIRVYPKTGRITIEGVNIVKRHRKARRGMALRWTNAPPGKRWPASSSRRRRKSCW